MIHPPFLAAIASRPNMTFNYRRTHAFTGNQKGSKFDFYCVQYLRIFSFLVAIITVLGISTAYVPLAKAQVNDPALVQNVTDAENFAPKGEKVRISHGHVDIGPVYRNGTLELLARDDTGSQPVWRYLEDITFEINESLTLPDGTGYEFTGARTGDELFVLPQTESPTLPWLGWNTQSPTLAELSPSGVNLKLAQHTGEGEHSLFLQSGGFGAPLVLWTTSNGGSVWAEINTHTHANWTFTAPGSHTVELNAELNIPGAEPMTTTASLNFDIAHDANPTARGAHATDAATASEGSWLMDPLTWLVAVLALMLVGIFIAIMRKAGRRER
ncbi:putative secreted protein [Corynebacterium kutscheri]|uniref:Actinobacterial surface-anchored protein domain n=1 Tax=Corynebacterium kutscheri TaxID=35755 RepID=A0A0F6R1T6_9CORY|nr:choice-of-anchor M domain-containing protein [Corynebacterium kutscheri]AKE42060.1 actinobacterial surface-anchored protein domain [Corynebacterium kutscheri]VEH06069.1 putative secreted protein [Corynebacterium kutscheri]VEH10401.1 putative secreted protein [Corynebacterium kutscheri]VEH81983.1 putative secreted protein [Corynebacterium kutscheri]